MLLPDYELLRGQRGVFLRQAELLAELVRQARLGLFELPGLALLRLGPLLGLQGPPEHRIELRQGLSATRQRHQAAREFHLPARVGRIGQQP